MNSSFTDFHCVFATGSCTDAQAIAGGGGNDAMGPYKIVGNFLEASGENIIFGGGAATATPTDIEIRQNHFFKPLIWMKGQAGYVGATNGNPFIVKNLLELKNAQRVLVEGNIMEYSWGGFSQSGFAILLTPKNQAGSATGAISARFARSRMWPSATTSFAMWGPDCRSPTPCQTMAALHSTGSATASMTS